MNDYLIQAERLPVLQNRTFADRLSAAGSPTGDLALTADPTTGIVTNVRFDPRLVVYDSAYHNEQSVSGVFRDHLAHVARIVRSHLDCSTLAEIGCGKGAFIETLGALGVRATGFDPAYEGNDPHIRKELFGKEASMRASGIVMRHVLEHIQSPVDFLRMIRDVNGGTGRIYIEVPCLDWILSNRAWFDVFYEHVNYFRLDDFRRMFGELIHAERTFGGQYLSIVGDLKTLRDPAKTSPPTWPADFTLGLARTMAQTRPDVPEVVWGAGSKGVIFSLYRERAGKGLAAAIDINPANQGRYLPVTGLPVLDPTSAIQRFPRGTVVWVMNPNYLPEVQKMSDNHFELRPVH
jgi:hypothetical protein